jgi:hypothetical protein
MDAALLRLECLKIARPDGIGNPDAEQIVARARRFYEFVTAGSEPEAPKRRGRPPKVVME